MPSIPLPFVLSLLLLMLLLRLLARNQKALRPAAVFVAICLVLVTMAGLRWTIDLPGLRLAQAALAALVPPIAWLCFAGLGPGSSIRKWRHYVLPGIVLLLLAGPAALRWPLIDLLLAALYLGYGAAILLRARGGPDCLTAARLTDAADARRAVLAVSWLLIASAAVDLLVAADFILHGGSHVWAIITGAQVIALALIALAVSVIGQSTPGQEADDATSSPASAVRPPPAAASTSAIATADDQAVMAALDAALRGQALYRDPELSLSRLARRLGLPARQLSGAVNRTLGRNVSQAVNDYRIEAAMTMLLTSDLSVTSVMFECGFQTKSNFNREFSRVTGQSPSDYRRSGRAPATSG